jgi:hypothetical protein
MDQIVQQDYQEHAAKPTESIREEHFEVAPLYLATVVDLVLHHVFVCIFFFVVIKVAGGCLDLYVRLVLLEVCLCHHLDCLVIGDVKDVIHFLGLLEVIRNHQDDFILCELASK